MGSWRRRNAVLAFVTLLAFGALAASAAAQPDGSIWIPPVGGSSPTAGVNEITSTWSMTGSLPCVPNYFMTQTFSNPTLSGNSCALYAGGAFAGTFLEFEGATGKLDVTNRWVVQPIPAPTGGAAWLHDDCSNLLKAGCYLTIDSRNPVYSRQSDGLHWVFDRPTAPRLGGPGSTGASFDTSSVSTSPDGRYAVAAAVDGSGVLWFDLDTGEVRKLMAWPAADVGQVRNAAVSVSPSGRYVAVGAGFPGNDGMTIVDTASCPAMTSTSGPSCPSTAMAPLSQVAGLPSSADSSRPLQVKFVDDSTLLFTARIGALLGQSTDTTRHNFRMRATAGSAAGGNSLFVMGDSFTAGEGDAGHYRDGTDIYDGNGKALNLCHQSTRAWPNLVASLLNSSPFITTACSGATTADLFTHTQWSSDNTHSSPFPGVAPQVTGIRRTFSPDTLLVQIGGNDAMFADILKTCVVGFPLDCTTQANERKWATQVQDAFYLVRQSLRRLHNEFPESRIVLVGYPAIVDPYGGCGIGVKLNQNERFFADDLALFIAQTMQAAAYSAGVQYISLLHALDGHQLCDPHPWVNGVIAGNDVSLLNISLLDHRLPVLDTRIVGNESFHPNATAHAEFAATIADALGHMPASPCGAVVCDAAATAPQPDFLPAISPTDTAAWQPQVTQTGSTFTISADGLQPASQVTGVIHSTPVPIPSAAVGSDGTLQLDVAILAGLDPGAHTVDLQGVAADGRPLTASIPFLVPAPGDLDGDGVPDSTDLCPTLPGGSSDTIDTDGDGIGDSCDPELSAPPAPGGPMLVSGATPNTGLFTLGWDPAASATEYRLERRHPGGDWSDVVAHSGDDSYAFPADRPESEGRWEYRVTATGPGGTGDPSNVSDDVVVDRTGPSAPIVTADRDPEDSSGGWFKDSAGVSFSGSSDPPLLDGTDGVDGVTYDVTQLFDTAGAHSATGRAYDALGNASAPSSPLTVKVDTDPPEISLSGCPTELVDEASVVSVSVNAHDPQPGSGLAIDPSGSVELDTAAIGPHSVTRNVTDRVGHTGSATCSYTVQSSKPTVPGSPTLTAPSATPNRGSFALAWSPSQNATSYRLEHRDSVGDWDVVATTFAPDYTFGDNVSLAETEGTWEYRVLAAGPGGTSDSSDASDPVKVDLRPPAMPTASVDRAPEYVGADGWYRNSVTVSFGDNGDPRLADGSIGSGVDPTSVPIPITVTTAGATTVRGSVRDLAGNHSADAQRVVQVDNTAPSLTITCPTAVLLHATASAAVTASDTGSGLANDPSGTVPIDTSIPGVKTTQRTALDKVGHATTRTCTTAVRYMFSGLVQPVNPDGSSIFKLGSTIPLKFTLTDSASAPVNDAVARVYLANVSSNVDGTYLEAVSTSAADTGNQFRQGTPGSYIFNLSSKGLSSGTWSVKATLDDGSEYKTLISLR